MELIWPYANVLQAMREDLQQRRGKIDESVDKLARRQEERTALASGLSERISLGLPPGQPSSGGGQ